MSSPKENIIYRYEIKGGVVTIYKNEKFFSEMPEEYFYEHTSLLSGRN